MCSTTAIGIDLGTTFCCVAVFQNGQPEIIKVQSQRTMPSTVFYNHRRQQVSVGGDAQDDAPQFIANEIYDAKRLIGRKYQENYVGNLVRAGQYPFEICSCDGYASYRIKYKNITLVKKPEDVSSEILRVLKEAASDFLGEEVTEAVVSVPAYFSNAQRKATKRAAELAGLKVLRFISEPVAAAVRYTFGKDVDKMLLVFDFGGGTLDVSIIQIQGKKYTVKAVHGDTSLGGRDVDDILMKHFNSQMNASDNPLLIRRLRSNCIKLKQKLSKQQRPVDQEVEQVFFDGLKEYCLPMSRETFDKLNKKIYDRAINVVAMCLDKAGMNKTDVDEVVLVGGSSKILCVQELLQEFFPDKPLRKNVDPDEAIALGAAIQAAILKKDNFELEDYSISEVTPLSIGFLAYGGYMFVAIPKNSPIPFKKCISSITVENYQTSILFEIYEGERSQARFNNKLGEFRIKGLPKGRCGGVKLEIVFSLDEDGILEVIATEKSTGNQGNLVVAMSDFQLGEYQLNKSLRNATENREEDETFVKFMQSRNDKLTMCRSIEYDANKIPYEYDKTLLQDICTKFINKAEEMDYHNIETLNANFKWTCRSLKPLIDKYRHYFLEKDKTTVNTEVD